MPFVVPLLVLASLFFVGQAPPLPAVVSPLSGTWVFLSIANGSTNAQAPGNRIKAFTDRAWEVTQTEPGTGVVQFHHGGTYALIGDAYTEKVDFANPNTAYLIGQTFTMTVTVTGDTMTQTGASGTETWHRVPPGESPAAVAARLGIKAPPEAPAPASPMRSGAPRAGVGGPYRVGADVKPPVKIVNVNPLYPKEALDARVQGLVVIEAVIAKDGSVTSARVVRSVPLLDQAALDAVAQWKYTPTMFQGQPVDIIMTVTVNFSLGG